MCSMHIYGCMNNTEDALSCVVGAEYILRRFNGTCRICERGRVTRYYEWETAFGISILIGKKYDSSIITWKFGVYYWCIY